MSDFLLDDADDYDGSKDYPRTADQWWALVNKYKVQLRNLVGTYHPCNARWAPPMKITAAAAEAVCDRVREEVEKETGEDPLVLFDRYVVERDRRLESLFSQAWFGVPESRDAHGLPGFGVLCDLCSESHVLYGEEEMGWEE